MNHSPMPLLNSNKLEELCQKIIVILNDNEQLLSHINQAVDILSAQISDLTDTENSKTLSIVEKICSSIR